MECVSRLVMRVMMMGHDHRPPARTFDNATACGRLLSCPSLRKHPARPTPRLLAQGPQPPSANRQPPTVTCHLSRVLQVLLTVMPHLGRDPDVTAMNLVELDALFMAALGARVPPSAFAHLLAAPGAHVLLPGVRARGGTNRWHPALHAS